MDALTHAIEAYVSNAQSALTDVHASKAIKLIIENIEKSYNRDRTIFDLNNMMLGSLHAGIAFSNASLGAVHALAHSLGGVLDLPHGKCNSILLCHVIDFNYSSSKERYNNIAGLMGIEKDKQSIINYINDLTLALGIPEKFQVNKLDKQLKESLIENALNDPCLITNPCELSKEDAERIYDKIIQQKNHT
jgi:alcohol dehydrogenase class IV